MELNFVKLKATPSIMANEKQKQNRVFIVGVGMTAFIKPRGQRDTSDVCLN
jgi:hypothetical protein